MLTQYILPIILAFLSGGGIFTFIIFLIQRKDESKKDHDEIMAKLNELQDQLDEGKLERTRLQLLNLIQHDGSTYALLQVAEKYFKDLNGDWYMTPIFYDYLKAHNMEAPAWFKGGEK